MTDKTAPQAAPRLVVIDCYSLLFRAFFGGRYLSTSDGRPTGALYGFANMLLMILDQEKPEAIYAAWDAPAKTFRHEQFEDYKAHRPEVADDLRQQFPVARQIVEAFGLTAVEMPRYEADDLIGTLATEGVREGYAVTIITGDSDQLQLVGDGVTVRITNRGVSDTTAYDADKVRERYGIPPERVPDFKALVGDTSDNIPGVPGIGEKTATKLLQEFGSLENLLRRVDAVEPQRARAALATNADQARKSLALATIHCEVPFDGPIQRYQPTPEVWARARELLNDLEFRSLLRRLPAPEEAAAPPPASHGAFQPSVSTIASDEELSAALAEARAARLAAIRLDTDGGPAPMTAVLRGLAFAALPGRAHYVRIAGGKGTPPDAGGLFADEQGERPFAVTLDALRPVLVDPGVERVGHNFKFDRIVLAQHGLEAGPFAFDTMVAAYLLNPGRAGYPLADLAAEHLGQRADGDPFAGPDRPGREAAAILALRGPMRDALAAAALTPVMDEIEMPLVPVLAEMEQTGVPVDRGWLMRLADEMGLQIDQVAETIYSLAGERFMINSTQQLQRVLFEKLQLPTGKKIKTGYSTRADLLESLAPQYPIAARILEYRELTKLKSTYADALPKLIDGRTGRIHTSLNQTVAATGRLSSSDPNLQNIPVRSEVGREIRKAFIAPPDQALLSCDYSQIELRVFAHVTQDPELLRAFDADEDIHAATATRLFNVDLEHVLPEMRRRAKTVNFAVIYGQSDFGLANSLGIPVAEARAFIDSYFAQFPGVKEYTEKTLAEARDRGYVQTLRGRRRYLPEIASGNFNVRQAAERAAVNMPIQGTAADIMKLAMIDVHRYLMGEGMCYNCVLLLQVHDELVFAVPRDGLADITPVLVRLMENADGLSVRLRVDAKAGANWAEMAPVPSA